MSPLQQLDLFTDLSAFEGVDVEYKSAKGGLPADLWQTYSAFGNTDGGTIYLGIAQRDLGLDVHGLDNVEKLLVDFWNTVNNKSKVNANLLTNADVEVLAIEGSERRVVGIHVPRASRHQRPIYVGTDPLTGTYRRNYEGDYHCTPAEVRRMFADRDEEPADSRLMQGFSFDDIDLDSLRQYRNRFMSRAPGHAWLGKDDLGLLEQLGGWRRERSGNREGLTLAGLLMFGKSLAIQAPEAVPGFHVDYRERLAEDPQVRWSDRVTIDGTWEANLFQFYQRVMAKFSADPGLKRPFSRDPEGVRPLATPVHDALQEALVNALIHADYGGQGGIVIERYVDHFEFSNPGTLLVSLEQILRGGVSECRNVSLQRMFQMLGVGDKAGSGIDKIRDSWKALHWQSPRFQETQRPDRVVLSLPMVSMLPESELSALHARFGEPFRALGKDSIQVLVTASVEGSVSNQRLQETLTLHRRDITTLLQSLVRGGYLVPDGIGRGTRYSLAGNAGTAAASSPVKPVSSPVKPASSPVKPASSPVKPASSPGNEEDLAAIAEPIRVTKRAKPAEVRNTILRLCAGRFLGLRDLASLLDRQQETLREDYISPMIKEGLLEQQFPEKPTHKDQAYRARDFGKDGAAS